MTVCGRRGIRQKGSSGQAIESRRGDFRDTAAIPFCSKIGATFNLFPARRAESMAIGKLWVFAATALALLMLLTGCAGTDEGATAAAAPAAPGWQETGEMPGFDRTESAAVQARAGADGASGNAIPVASFPKSDAAAAIPTPAPRAMAADTDDGSNRAAAGRETGQFAARQIISTAELTIAAESVERAVIRARNIAADFGRVRRATIQCRRGRTTPGRFDPAGATAAVFPGSGTAGSPGRSAIPHFRARGCYRAAY